MTPLEKQTNYQIAFDRGLERLRGQHAASLKALGGRVAAPGRLELPVLDVTFVFDLDAGVVTRKSGDDVGMAWRILAVHYLGACTPWPQSSRWVSFADFAEVRGYESVYGGRVLGRLCGTAGRDEATFVSACQSLGAEPADWGDVGFRFQVFPHLPVVIAWYGGDGEFPPNASFLYPDNALSLLPAEDMVVLSERLVSLLQSKGW